MKLSEWLDKNDRTLDWLAGELEVSTGSASRMARGQQNIPLSTVGKIERLTNGAVTAAELLASFQEHAAA